MKAARTAPLTRGTLRRLLAVVAAVCLVTAVAAGSILPPTEPLGQFLADLNDHLLPTLQSHQPGWTWQSFTLPLLSRPPWLPPLALGIIALGTLLTLNWQTHPTTRRKR